MSHTFLNRWGVVGGLLLSVAGAPAATIRVPQDYADLEAAINLAASGDEIVVADGVYAGKGWIELDFRGKSLHVRSSGGPERCVIDCQGSTRAFVFNSAETSQAIVNGFTIRQGRMPYFGGAMFITGGAEPTIRNCHFIENSVFDPFCLGGCTTYGGALALLDAGTPRIRECVFYRNAAQLGGALNVTRSGAQIERCRFVSNVALESTELNAGGAIYAEAAQITIESTLFNANLAESLSGFSLGGAITAFNADIAIDTSTFSGNFASGGSDALYAADVSDVRIADSIVWNATNPPLGLDDSTIISCSYSDVQFGWPGLGNVALDPRFVRIFGADGEFGTLDDDFQLAVGSPCIDTGVPEFSGPSDARDLSGRLRVWDGDTIPGRRVDMGALERAAPGPGDLNCDGAVDFDDIAAFVLALTGEKAYAAEFPGCAHFLADADASDVVDFNDIDAFVALLSRGG